MAEQPRLIIRHANGTTTRIYTTWVETNIPGLPTVHAVPCADQRETAHRLGYVDETALTLDHDPLHAWLASTLGLPASYSLSLAAGADVDPTLAELEEAAVMALQAFCVAAGVKPWGEFGF